MDAPNVRKRKITMTANRTLPALITLALAATLLTGCASATPATPATPAALTTAAAPAAAAATSSAPAPTATNAPAAPVADKNSQVVDGKLYQGTELAPVKIGADTPGQAPAIQASAPKTLQGAGATAKAAGKYLVSIAPRYAQSGGQGGVVGYSWAIYGYNEYGTYRAIADQGLTNGDRFPTRDAALAAPKVIDGRTLDRAEYVLVVI